MESNYPQQLPFPFDEQPKLLVVDDDRETRFMLAWFFEDRGYAVLTAKTGIEALELIKQEHSIDVILLDVFLPQMGGLEVLSEIQKIKPHPGVIIVSAVADREIAQDAFRLGAFDYILKPFDLGQVESTVVACLGHSEYQRQSWWKRMFKPAA